MAYQNTGYARNKTLTVTKGDYTHSYNITDSFVVQGGRSYSALSNQAFARLSPGDYNQRLADFITYVCMLEDGLAQDCPDLTTGSVIYDPDSCPVPTQEEEND
ncbi:MAG: hypothetical protein IJL44_07445 [Bacteroidales bacterium]|nr:hypothetical protein [Bacteroidales bacterium]